MRLPHLCAAAAVALGVALTGCSSGSTTPTAASPSTPAAQSTASSPSATSSPSAAGPASTTAPAGGSHSSGSTALAQAVAYSQCIRSHGVPNFPDPVQTPSGGYGYRTAGIDPNSAAFQAALQACRALPSPWNSTAQQLSPAQQQAWLKWAGCIRSHGLADFPDPTFSGGEVHDSGLGSTSPQLQQAMDACRSRQPSVGGLGG